MREMNKLVSGDESGNKQMSGAHSLNEKMKPIKGAVCDKEE